MGGPENHDGAPSSARRAPGPGKENPRGDGNAVTDAPVGRALLKISAPMSLGILGVLLIGLADAFFLARVGEAELAAIGFVYPVIVAVSAFSIGMSAGANTTLSQAMGRGVRPAGIARLTLHATGFGAGIGLAIAAALALAAPFLFDLLGAEGAVLDAILVYLPWWAASFPILVVTMILNAAFRARGDGATPSAIMVMTAILNIALTPALVFGVGPVGAMGMAGAGISTLIARTLALGVALWFTWWRGHFAVEAGIGPDIATSLRDITSVGLPAAFSRAVNPAGMALVTAAVATVGAQAVAGFGAAARVQAVTLVPFFALSAGLAPVVGQAWGAELHDRAREALRLGTRFAVAYGVVAGAALWLLSEPLAAAMTANGQAADFTAQYLRVVGWSLAGYGLVIAANAALTARSRATWALGLSLARIGLVYVPLAWIGVGLFGYAGVLGAAVLANLAGAWGALAATQANALARLHAVDGSANALRRVAGARRG